MATMLTAIRECELFSFTKVVRTVKILLQCKNVLPTIQNNFSVKNVDWLMGKVLIVRSIMSLQGVSFSTVS